MSKSNHTQAGFSVLEGVLVLLVLGTLVFVGYTFANKRSSTATLSTQSTQESVPKVSDNKINDAEVQAATTLPNDNDDSTASHAAISSSNNAEGGYNEATN